VCVRRINLGGKGNALYPVLSSFDRVWLVSFPELLQVREPLQTAAGGFYGSKAADVQAIYVVPPTASKYWRESNITVH